MTKVVKGLGYLAYGVVILLVFGLAAYTSFSLFVRSGVTTVPPVEGLTQADATARLTDQGLRLRGIENEGRYSEKVPAGKILRQNPDARTLVKRGSFVTVVLSKGPQRVEVPEVASQNLPAAQAALAGSGLTVGQILGAYSSTLSTGSVVTTDPSPGVTIPPSTPVNVLLALSVPNERYLMPDLVYRDYEGLRPYFEQHGFRFGSVKYERYEGVAAGVILRQFPLPGHPLTKQDNISLVVATADTPTDSATPPAAETPAPAEETP
ncbi:MAG TPA: PASTA domain-containing protein [Thermoanaerobaculia bacterium]|jgi:serine/threonine-protein kinase|nr:PASTA domain-containing protein [Thermoanaerobaculia bacterium]